MCELERRAENARDQWQKTNEAAVRDVGLLPPAGHLDSCAALGVGWFLAVSLASDRSQLPGLGS